MAIWVHYIQFCLHAKKLMLWNRLLLPSSCKITKECCYILYVYLKCESYFLYYGNSFSCFLPLHEYMFWNHYISPQYFWKSVFNIWPLLFLPMELKAKMIIDFVWPLQPPSLLTPLTLRHKIMFSLLLYMVITYTKCL